MAEKETKFGSIPDDETVPVSPRYPEDRELDEFGMPKYTLDEVPEELGSEEFMGYTIHFFERRMTVTPELPVQDVWAEPRGDGNAWYVNDGITNPTAPNQDHAIRFIHDAIMHYAGGTPPDIPEVRPEEDIDNPVDLNERLR